MKSFRKFVIATALLSSASASAQFYEIANQIPQLITPALTGGFNYRGFVDAGYNRGVGENKADFVELTTTQGFQYSNWFFMGVGIGVQAIMTNPNGNGSEWNSRPGSFDSNRGHCKTGCMIPLYSDFRFNIGREQSSSFFIDLRIGASFLMSNNYLEIGNGYLTKSECFYFKPTMGISVPLSENGRQAVNIGVSYLLTTNSYWYNSYSNVSLSSIGVSVGFQW